MYTNPCLRDYPGRALITLCLMGAIDRPHLTWRILLGFRPALTMQDLLKLMRLRADKTKPQYSAAPQRKLFLKREATIRNVFEMLNCPSTGSPCCVLKLQYVILWDIWAGSLYDQVNVMNIQTDQNKCWKLPDFVIFNWNFNMTWPKLGNVQKEMGS